MKTSVVMATYNGEKFLQQQLASILSQTVLPDELVVVDDGSIDNTRQLLTDFSEKYGHEIEINLVFREENLGYIGNFIDGISRASNELIFLCDQDDEWSTKKIEDISLLFGNKKDIIALHSNTDIIDNEGKTIVTNAQEYKKTLKKIGIKQFVKKVNYPGMALVFRKSVILPKLMELSNNVDLPTHDWVIALIACLSDGLYISNKVYTYRRETGLNVALKIEEHRISNIDRRIEGIELYERYFVFLLKVNNSRRLYIPLDTSRYLKCSENRKNYLKTIDFFAYLINLSNLFYYPSLKSYFADGLLIVKRN